MNDERESEIARFIIDTEEGKKRVYQEHQTMKDIVEDVVIPFFIMMAVSTLFFIIYLLSPNMFSIFLLVVASFIIIFCLLLITRNLLNRPDVSNYSFKGHSRLNISNSIRLLDLFGHGYHHDGDLVVNERPAEYKKLSRMAFSNCIGLIQSCGLGNNTWKSVIRESIEADTQKSKKYLEMCFRKLLVFFVFGSMSILILLIVLIIQSTSLIVVFEFIPFLLFIMLPIFLIGAAFYLRELKPLPLNVKFTLNDLYLRSDLQNTLDSLLDILVPRIRYPLRLLLISKYPILKYTGRKYLTTEGITLHEAIMLPKI